MADFHQHFLSLVSECFRIYHSLSFPQIHSFQKVFRPCWFCLRMSFQGRCWRCFGLFPFQQDHLCHLQRFPSEGFPLPHSCSWWLCHFLLQQILLYVLLFEYRESHSSSQSLQFRFLPPVQQIHPRMNHFRRSVFWHSHRKNGSLHLIHLWHTR